MVSVAVAVEVGDGVSSCVGSVACVSGVVSCCVLSAVLCACCIGASGMCVSCVSMEVRRLCWAVGVVSVGVV